MDWLQAIALALLQGLTEFLPISSSAHLILLPRLVDWPDQGLAFDVAVHVGSLVSVVTYFRHDIGALWRGWWRSVGGGETDADGRLAWMVIVATLPVVLAGWLLSEWADAAFRDPLLIASTTMVFGVALWLADHFSRRNRDERRLRWRDVIIVGCAQALALLPGTSRSGVTITAGLMLGLTRSAASRFSFLLSIPVILAAGAMKTLELTRTSAPVLWLEIAVAAVVSCVAAYACIHFFLKLIERVGVVPFVLYRLVLGFGLFYLYSN